MNREMTEYIETLIATHDDASVAEQLFDMILHVAEASDRAYPSRLYEAIADEFREHKNTKPLAEKQLVDEAEAFLANER